MAGDEPLQDDPVLRAYQLEATRLREDFGPIEDVAGVGGFGGVLFACWRRHGCPRNDEARRVEAEWNVGFADDPDMRDDGLRMMVPMAAAWPQHVARLASKRRAKLEAMEADFGGS